MLVEYNYVIFHNERVMRELRLFDVSLRSAYAQAKELTRAQGQVPLVTPGSLQVELRGNHRFVYRYRGDANGRRVAEYLGPADEESTRTKVDEATAAIRDAETLAEYSRDLRRVGFYGANNSTVVTVASIFNAGMFSDGAVLVGTHAFGALLNELGVRAFTFPMTEDVALARPQRIPLAALPKGGLLSLLRDTGLSCHEVPQLKRSAPATSLYPMLSHKRITGSSSLEGNLEPYRIPHVQQRFGVAAGVVDRMSPGSTTTAPKQIIE
jgi:hypothetical protein